MEKLIIQEERKNCPGMYYYPEKNMLEVKGRSIPENPEAIFKRLDEWITDHFKTSDSLDVDFILEYINSGSSKFLYEILKKLANYINKGKKVNIRWLYEEDDEAMLELGEHYRDTAGIPLTIEMI
ncbi:MAG TPA: DUF1987 domain-containing protein [Bacteroidales bacterium]|nr:DUF1987 domain-containing protein [Bacteroidales bacterium]HQG36738.1 DUF1987 domain-containing protein [Bacteroidales bacterium]HQG52858.1 DUF1987 domain-containing protein [Bacteroidales bacterium]HQJ20177.1 DUF1987 domain-containing protein [Bacteroidales bacterium]